MPGRRKSFLKPRLIVLGILVILFLAALSYWNFLKSPVDKSNDQKKVFVVKKGQSSANIAQDLEKQNLIHSSLVFKVLLRLSGQGRQIQAGDFKLSQAMSTEDIIHILSSGSVDRWVTLIEGWRVEEMAKNLSDELGVKSDEFVKVAKEGYMFPDTYLFNPDAKASDIAATLRNNFNQKFDESLQSKMVSKGLTPPQGVILASIVEREARSDQARTEVASILLKRLKMDMGLNVDATVQYGLGYQPSEKSWWKKNLTPEDLKVNSPYNTYLHSGLPPAPICNPSLSSLQAVANADPNTPYLYYYHDSEGNSHYAKTLEEHNENISTYP